MRVWTLVSWFYPSLYWYIYSVCHSSILEPHKNVNQNSCVFYSVKKRTHYKKILLIGLQLRACVMWILTPIKWSVFLFCWVPGQNSSCMWRNMSHRLFILEFWNKWSIKLRVVIVERTLQHGCECLFEISYPEIDLTVICTGEFAWYLHQFT